MLRSYRTVFRNQPFMLLWWGSLVSNFGDRFTEFALAWYVLGRTQNPLDVGLTFLVFQLPGLFTGLLVGWLLDRFRREAVMLLDNLLRGGLVLLVPLLDSWQMLSLPILYLITALLGALSVVTVIGSRTLITDYVPPQDYNPANSLYVIQAQVSAIVGPGIAGVLIYLIGPLTLLWIDSCSFFLLALVLLVLLKKPRQMAQIEIETPLPISGFWRPMLEGLSFTFRSPLLLALLSISFCWNFGLGIYQVALPFYCQDVLKVGPAGMGLLVTTNAVGALLSALVFGPLRPRYPGRVTCLLLLSQAVCYVLLGGFPIFWLALLLSLTLGAFDDVGAVYLTTIRQRAIPAPLMGRVLAFTGTVGPSGAPLGSGLAGFLVAGFGPVIVVAFAGVPLLGIALVWLNTGPIRQVQETDRKEINQNV